MNFSFGRICKYLQITLLCFVLCGCGPKEIAPVFDVPSLLNGDIENATRVLGKPTREETVDNQLRRVWEKDGVSLWANWKPDSKRVTRWSFQARPNSEAVGEANRAKLLRAVQANENDARYSVEWIESPEKTLSYTGATIVPAPRQHKVVLRVGGTGALVQVSTQPQPPDAQGAQFMTLTPWETSFTVPDDTKLSLGLQLFKRVQQDGSAFSMKLQIEVDGKIVRDVTTPGPPLTTGFEI